MSGWTKRSDSETLVGTLKRVYVPGGLFSDNDTNLVIEPDLAHRSLLINRKGKANDLLAVECEINVFLTWRPTFNEWAKSMLFTPVTAVGVYVDDDGHQQKTELHPVDLVVGRVNQPLIPHDPSWWVTAYAAGRGLTLDEDLFVYRFLAASDTRDGLLFTAPPLALFTRTVRLDVPLPPLPGSSWTPYVRDSVAMIAGAQSDVRVVGTGGNRKVRIEVTCKAVDHDGPGVVLGEAAAHWKNPAVPEVMLDPTSVSFGQVIPMRTATRTVRISNTGAATLVVSTPPPPGGAHGIFSWEPFTNVAIAPGGHRDVTLTFFPRTPGTSSGSWHVDTNNAIGPHTVQLTGTGRNIIPE